ncbi:hypothetical protein TSAR_000286 [Trichomalopsis sarcophagae]|uniref:Uncharacterized protein n=1 Tax=Trichomalopsis sarcophagae TaxID=543379 RepID=A0A232EEH4_9HYME|nr:hypothetical protein TSAR_000286 [Trichomalopsis sarcophagae]
MYSLLFSSNAAISSVNTGPTDDYLDYSRQFQLARSYLQALEATLAPAKPPKTVSLPQVLVCPVRWSGSPDADESDIPPIFTPARPKRRIMTLCFPFMAVDPDNMLPTSYACLSLIASAQANLGFSSPRCLSNYRVYQPEGEEKKYSVLKWPHIPRGLRVILHDALEHLSTDLYFRFDPRPYVRNTL